MSHLKLQFFHKQYLFFGVCVCVVRSYDVHVYSLEISTSARFNMSIFVCITQVSDIRMIRVDTNKQARSNIIGSESVKWLQHVPLLLTPLDFS